LEHIFRAGLFEGDVAIVTGGGTGIGFVVARELGTLGAKIAICGRRAEPLAKAAAELAEDGIEVHHQTCDIRKPEEVEALVDATKERFGHVSILVNNAGGQFPTPAEHLAPSSRPSAVASST
jgi:citronellol/citronellal dehydrogenase